MEHSAAVGSLKNGPSFSSTMKFLTGSKPSAYTLYKNTLYTKPPPRSDPLRSHENLKSDKLIRPEQKTIIRPCLKYIKVITEKPSQGTIIEKKDIREKIAMHEPEKN